MIIKEFKKKEFCRANRMYTQKIIRHLLFERNAIHLYELEYYLYHFYKEEFTYYFIGAKRNLKIDLSNLGLFVYIGDALIYVKTFSDTWANNFFFHEYKISRHDYCG